MLITRRYGPLGTVVTKERRRIEACRNSRWMPLLSVLSARRVGRAFFCPHFPSSTSIMGGRSSAARRASFRPSPSLHSIHPIPNNHVASTLCLPAPRSTAIGRPIRRSTGSIPIGTQIMLTARESSPRLGHGRHLLVLHLHERRRGPAAALRHWLLVCSEVEGDEEKKIRSNDTDPGNSCKFLARAFAGVGEVRPVGAGEVSPGREVDEAWKGVSMH
jgi:hypothetical protein